MVKPRYQEWCVMAALVFLCWGAISVPFIVADDVARAALISILAGFVLLAPKLLPIENQVARGRIKEFGDLSGGALAIFAFFFAFSSILPNLARAELLYALAIFTSGILVILCISFSNLLSKRNP